jgi:hypothetical protein
MIYYKKLPDKENYLFYFRMMAKRVPKFQNLEGIQIFYVVSNFDVFFFFELIMIRTSGGLGNGHSVIGFQKVDKGFLLHQLYSSQVYLESKS